MRKWQRNKKKYVIVEFSLLLFDCHWIVSLPLYSHLHNLLCWIYIASSIPFFHLSLYLLPTVPTSSGVEIYNFYLKKKTRKKHSILSQQSAHTAARVHANFHSFIVHTFWLTGHRALHGHGHKQYIIYRISKSNIYKYKYIHFGMDRNSVFDSNILYRITFYFIKLEKITNADHSQKFTDDVTICYVEKCAYKNSIEKRKTHKHTCIHTHTQRKWGEDKKNNTITRIQPQPTIHTMCSHE